MPTANTGQGDTGTAHLLLEPSRGFDLLAELPSGWNVLALLYDGTSDEWYRRWTTEVGWEPDRQGLVEMYDLSRGGTAAGTATTQTVPGRGITLTTVKRPVSTADVLETVDAHLNRWNEGGARSPPLVYVDSLAELAADASDGVEANGTDVNGADANGPVSVVSGLLDRVAPADGRVYVCLDGTSADARTVDQLSGAVDVVHGDRPVDPGVVAAVARLRRDDPTNFGYARRHWAEARVGIEAATRNYPLARQIHEAIPDPETTPRTLGATLKALATLGAIDVWDDTNGANRYDLTAYDPDRLVAVGAALDESTE